MIENPRAVFDSIVESTKEVGYDPYSQLYGYLQDGDSPTSPERVMQDSSYRV